MKTLTLLTLSFFLYEAHASSTVVKCSNADGSVTWDSSFDRNTINLKYANFVEGTLSLDLDQVNIEFSKEVILKQKTFRTCREASHGKVYAGKVKITASEAHPDVLRGQFPLNKVDTEVICSMYSSNTLPCPTED